MNRWKSLSAMSLAVMLLAACGSSDLGGILGGSQSDSYEIRGVVDSVDTGSRSIILTNVSGYNTMLSGGGNAVRVYYDTNTPVEFGGQTYRPENLERGDEVSVTVDESGNTLVAERVTVLRDVSSGTIGSGTYVSTIRGTVRYVDTSRGTIEIDRGSGSLLTVDYDSQTPVYYNNQTYRPADLERGDQVDIQVRDLGNGRYVAQDIRVTYSVSGSGSSSSQFSTVRGSVVWVDPNNQTMQLSSVSWISRFSGSGSTASTITVRYPTNGGVEVQGRLYPMTNLERGDLVEVQLRDAGTSYMTAERVILVRDVRQ
jgi:hypothetical protein